MVEVEAIWEPDSPARRDLLLAGVSVTACNRELSAVSAVRGRIGEGGRSKRSRVGFGSEGGCLFTIGNTRPRWEEEEEDGRDTKPGTEIYLPSRRCQRRAEGCWWGEGAAGGGETATASNGHSSPFWQIPPLPASLLASHLCLSASVPLSLTPFSSLPSLNVRLKFSWPV